MRIVQKIIILLNFKPFTYLFQTAYSFGLKRLVNVLIQQPAVHSIFGCGSFFGGRCLYGLSDIDLIIVIDERFTRSDLEPHQIKDAYNNIRRLFPFLGNWYEKAENLIFLSEIRSGFPVPESFCLRWKQGRLFQLHGREFPQEYLSGTVEIDEIIAEIDTLLRTAVTKGEVHASNLLFWKRMFSKLIALAATLGYEEIEEAIRCHEMMGFLERHEIILFIQKSEPDRLFPVLLDFSKKIFDQIRECSSSKCLSYKTADDMPMDADEKTASKNKDNGSKLLKEIGKVVKIHAKTMAPPLIGITPQHNYFPIEAPVCVVEVKTTQHRDLRTILKVFGKSAEDSESLLLRFMDFFFIVSKHQTYVDVVPLDPLRFGNVYVKFINDKTSFDMTAPVYLSQKKISDEMFLAFADLYQKNEGRVTKMPFPCLYLEDDLSVIRDAFHRLRVFLVHHDGVDCTGPTVLVKFLRGKYPECSEFLKDLLAYYNFLIGKNEKRRYANNLYRCLHQFMAQALSGSKEIHIDKHRQHLGITVGIITRNRADDLSEALDSLARQTRPPDEVLIVDNGSIDQTRDVIERFKQKLPVICYFLEKASIPMARNMVIENARHEIISFTDDDCIVDPGWVDAVERGFLRADNIGIVGGWVMHEPAPEPSIVDTYYSLFPEARPSQHFWPHGNRCRHPRIYGFSGHTYRPLLHMLFESKGYCSKNGKNPFYNILLCRSDNQRPFPEVQQSYCISSQMGHVVLW